MKKGHGLQREVPFISVDELRKQPTKQLLGRMKRLRFCEESFEGSDLLESDILNCHGILFKNTPEWKEAYQTLKFILADREHIARRLR